MVACVLPVMTRDIFMLTKQPQLRKKWISVVVEYIREKYSNPMTVDAIVGPDTRGIIFAVTVAEKLDLPYIPLHKLHTLRTLPADPNDLIHETYTNCEHKVYFLLEIFIF